MPSGINMSPQTTGDTILLLCSPAVYAGKKVAESPAKYSDKSLIAKLPDEYKPETKGEQFTMVMMPGKYAVNKTIKAKVGQKESDPVKKGAAIGAGVQIAADVASIASAGYLCKKLVGGTFKENVIKGLKDAAELYGKNGKYKYMAVAALGVGVSAAIGAGIGKLVKNHQEKKAAEQEKLAQDVAEKLAEEE